MPVRWLSPDLGAAFNASGSGFTLLAKAGLSSGLIVRTGNRSGIRLDVVRHVYFDSQTSAPSGASAWALPGCREKLPRHPDERESGIGLSHHVDPQRSTRILSPHYRHQLSGCRWNPIGRLTAA
jgi:hypothetical protein